MVYGTLVMVWNYRGPKETKLTQQDCVVFDDNILDFDSILINNPSHQTKTL